MCQGLWVDLLVCWKHVVGVGGDSRRSSVVSGQSGSLFWIRVVECGLVVDAETALNMIPDGRVIYMSILSMRTAHLGISGGVMYPHNDCTHIDTRSAAELQ